MSTTKKTTKPKANAPKPTGKEAKLTLHFESKARRDAFRGWLSDGGGESSSRACKTMADAWREMLIQAAALPVEVGAGPFPVPDGIVQGIRECSPEDGEDIAMQALGRWASTALQVDPADVEWRALAITHVTAFAEAFVAIGKARRS